MTVTVSAELWCYNAAPMDKETDFFGDVLKIALGIFFGGLLLWAGYQYYVRYQFAQAAKALEESVAAIEAEHDRAVAQQRHETEQREASLRRQRSVDWQQQQRYAEAARAKELAWREFYKPSVKCLSESSVECGNAYIRARREFERRYDAGERF